MIPLPKVSVSGNSGNNLESQLHYLCSTGGGTFSLGTKSISSENCAVAPPLVCGADLYFQHWPQSQESSTNATAI